MKIMKILKIVLLAVIAIVLVAAAWLTVKAGEYFYGPLKDLAIKKITRTYDADARRGEIVFYGASNFARWTEMETDLAPYPVQNHGFGGSADKDLMFYADRLLYP